MFSFRGKAAFGMIAIAFMNLYKVKLRGRDDEIIEAEQFRREQDHYVFEADGDRDVRFFLASEVIGIDLLPPEALRATGGGSY